MKAIIRNSSHGNDIVVSKILDKQLRCDFVEKVSTTARGIQALKNEYQGYTWYNQSLGQKIDISKNETENRFCLKLGFINGYCVDYMTGLLKNTAIIEKIIKHYCDVWSRQGEVNGRACIHGDLSLYNVLITNSIPVIIDWEHYNENALPIGFDALYLLFVSLFFEIGKNKLPNDRMLDFIREQIGFIRKAKCLSMLYETAPLAAVIKGIHENDVIWNLSSKDIAGKLPVLQWPTETVDFVDRKLNN